MVKQKKSKLFNLNSTNVYTSALNLEFEHTKLSNLNYFFRELYNIIQIHFLNLLIFDRGIACKQIYQADMLSRANTCQYKSPKSL